MSSYFQGVFVFKKGELLRKHARKNKYKIKSAENLNLHFNNKLWYNAYRELWNDIEDEIEVCVIDLNNYNRMKNVLFPGA